MRAGVLTGFVGTPGSQLIAPTPDRTSGAQSSEDAAYALAVLGSIILGTSVMRLAGKPLSSA